MIKARYEHLEHLVQLMKTDAKDYNDEILLGYAKQIETLIADWKEVDKLQLILENI